MSNLKSNDAKYFNELGNQLALLYEDSASARRVAQSAGLDTSHIDFSGSASVIWTAILNEARKSNRGLKGVMRIALTDYPDNREMVLLIARMPDADSVAEGVEKIISQMETLETKVTSMQSDTQAMQKDIKALRVEMKGMKKNIIDGVLQWAVSAGDAA